MKIYTHKTIILIWRTNNFLEMGGGTEYDFFEGLKEVEDKVNELTKDSRVTISFCGNILDEIKFNPVEKIIRWEVDRP